ncbi:right-handed parallel beta-helix repeat-containing protein [Hydrogenimonas thermophila]|uniref:Right handed beta helix region n=1 Tax=Hydrogenimonas thermophila TaxID=223786 RepID=A0A1I5R2S2_9BACT|nr:right-handed parallel beta-helix repeat-containing protein [Hydrogenimonas thermophila]SFP52854.1 Right handed beta helix region [Hydrogenimonas thermophila]
MNKFFFIMSIFCIALFGKTIVVSKLPIYSCVSGDETKSSIDDALKVAVNGDTINICPGTYTISKSLLVTKKDITLEGMGDEIDDVVIESSSKAITIKNENITLKNFKIESNDIGIYGDWNGTGDHNFEDLIIQSTATAIQIDHGSKQTFKNLNITSNSGKGIDLPFNTTGEHIFDNITIVSYDTSIYVGQGGLDFTNLNLTSNNARGLDVEKTNNDLNFDNIIIKSKTEGIYTSEDVDGEHVLNKIIIDSDGTGISFARGFSSLKDSNITSKVRGIDLAPYRDLLIDNVSIDTSSGSDHGIVLNWGDTVDITIKNSKITAGGDGIYTNNSNEILIDSVIIDGGQRGIYLPWNMKNITIQNCIIKNTTDWALVLDADVSTPANIKENCFYGDKEVKANGWDASHHHNFDGNYYDGVSDIDGDGKITSSDSSKIEGYVEDSLFKNECQNSETSATFSNPIVNYQMDECRWDADSSTYEIKNSGTFGKNINATSKFDARNEENITVGGGLCKVGNFIGSKHIVPQNNILLDSEYTVIVWIKFPLSDENHETYCFNIVGNSIDCSDNSVRWLNQYYNIADREDSAGASLDSSDSFIFFKKYKRKYWPNWRWAWCIDDKNGDPHCKNFTMPSDGWHMVTFMADGGENKTKVYIDKDEKDFINYVLTGISLNRIFASDYGGNEGNQSIGAYVDEFKIFNQDIDEDKITEIYNNEKSGKNYDGSIRDCLNCSEQNESKVYKFYAWDTFRDKDDRRISTKIVNQDFNLTIASLDENGTDYKEFNGTVCVILVDSNNNDINYTSWYRMEEFIADNNESLISKSNWTDINVTKAAKEVSVKIAWKNNVDKSCPLVEEDNDTTSAEKFAVRPEKFVITNIINNLKAGESFDLNVKTTSQPDGYNGSAHIDVNISDGDRSCPKVGADLNISDINFINGESNNSAKFNDIGEVYLNMIDKNWASVDNNDTPQNCDKNGTYICFEKINLTITPHHFQVSTNLNNFNDDFTYFSSDLNMSARLDINITAQNMENQTTKNYNSTCYARDIDINVSTNTRSDLPNLLYIYTDAKGTNSTLQNVGINMIYKDQNFTTDNNGSTYIRFYINYDRNYSKSINPFKLSVIDINITDINGTFGNARPDKNVTFYYGRIKFKDIRTTEKDINNTGYVLVYSENKLDGFIQYSSNWYINKNHSDIKEGNITNAEAHENTVLASSEKSDINISSEEPNEGKINITISHNYNESFKSYIHIDINDSKWLWYVLNGFGGAYSFDNNSDCTVHPCFEYEYINKSNDSKNGVISGDFNGSDFDLNISMPQRKRGVKIFR